MAWTVPPTETPPTAVEIFAGGGLMSLALDIEGVIAQHHCELDPSAAATIRHNIDPDAVSCDVRAYHPEPTPGGLDILVGGPPCQPWSQGGVQKGKDDPRNLWPEVLRLMEEGQPRVVLMENVHGILHKKHQPYLEWWWGEAAALGYTGVIWKVLGADYGSPQRRGRVWFVLYPEGAPWAPKLLMPPPPTHVDPRKIEAGKSDLLPWVRAFDQLNDGCCGGFGYSSCVNLGNLGGMCGGCVNGSNYEMATGEETDEDLSANARKYLQAQASMAKHPPVDAGGVFAWDELKKGVRRTTGTYLAPTVPKGKERSEHMYFGTREGVVGPGELSCAIDEWIPVLRQLTVREIAKLQSVPQWYIFRAAPGLSEEKRQRAMKAQVGNGIDVNMGRAVARHVLGALGYTVPFPGSQSEEQALADAGEDAYPQGLWPLYQIGMCNSPQNPRLTGTQIHSILHPPLPDDPTMTTPTEIVALLSGSAEALTDVAAQVEGGNYANVVSTGEVLALIAQKMTSFVAPAPAPLRARHPKFENATDAEIAADRDLTVRQLAGRYGKSVDEIKRILMEQAQEPAPTRNTQETIEAILDAPTVAAAAEAAEAYSPSDVGTREFRDLMVAASYGAFTSPRFLDNTFKYLDAEIQITDRHDGTFLVSYWSDADESSRNLGAFSDAAAAVQAVQAAVSPAAPAVEIRGVKELGPKSKKAPTKGWYVWAEDSGGRWVQLHGPYKRKGTAQQIMNAWSTDEAMDEFTHNMATVKELKRMYGAGSGQSEHSLRLLFAGLTAKDQRHLQEVLGIDFITVVTDYAHLDNWEPIRRGDGLDVLRSKDRVFEIRGYQDAAFGTWVYDLYYKPTATTAAGALKFYDSYEGTLEAAAAADQLSSTRQSIGAALERGSNPAPRRADTLFVYLQAQDDYSGAASFYIAPGSTATSQLAQDPSWSVGHGEFELDGSHKWGVKFYPADLVGELPPRAVEEVYEQVSSRIRNPWGEQEGDAVATEGYYAFPIDEPGWASNPAPPTQGRTLSVADIMAQHPQNQ